MTNVIVKSVPEVDKAMNAGIRNRKVGETNMNSESSRSHSIFTLYIEMAEEKDVTYKINIFRTIQENKE